MMWTDGELIRAIRAKCTDCSGGSMKEIERCRVTDCPLYKYRAERISKPKRKNELKQISVFELEEEAV